MDEMLESWQESPHGGHVIGDVIAGEIWIITGQHFFLPSLSFIFFYCFNTFFFVCDRVVDFLVSKKEFFPYNDWSQRPPPPPPPLSISRFPIDSKSEKSNQTKPDKYQWNWNDAHNDGEQAPDANDNDDDASLQFNGFRHDLIMNSFCCCIFWVGAGTDGLSCGRAWRNWKIWCR